MFYEEMPDEFRFVRFPKCLRTACSLYRCSARWLNLYGPCTPPGPSYDLWQLHALGFAFNLPSLD